MSETTITLQPNPPAPAISPETMTMLPPGWTKAEEYAINQGGRIVNLRLKHPTFEGWGLVFLADGKTRVIFVPKDPVEPVEEQGIYDDYFEALSRIDAAQRLEALRGT